MSLMRWLVMGFLMIGFPSSSARPSAATLPPPAALSAILTGLVQQQNEATLTDKPQALDSLYLPMSRAAEATEAKAMKRLLYLKDWSRARQVQFVGVTTSLRTGPMRYVSANEVRIYAVASERYRYRHLTGNTALNWFGLGVYHWYTIARMGGRWYLKSDTFIDPLNQDTRLKGPAHPATIRVSPSGRARGPLNSGARLALQYAARYCGAAPGCGNHHRYNPQYEDFNWEGGDCTNFISQVLKAGGFETTRTWAWEPGRGDGTNAWVNATALASYLVHAGMATLYAEGTLPQLLKAQGSKPSPVQRLVPGDLIGYREGGRVVHMALVVGYDSDGYPVVISHSADRFHEPWDLGWDRTTRYLLFHVHWPSSLPGIRPRNSCRHC